jgi:hypothetical protein
MSEFIRKAIEKAIILKKKPHLKPPASSGVNVVGQHRTRQALRRYLREANPEQADRWPELPDIEDNGQLRLLTRRLLGMRHEFKSYDKTGEEERRDFLRAGIVGAGLTAAGGLAGLGLYKAGVSAAARNAAQLGGELNRAKKSLKGIRDWKLAKATSARATAAGQKSAYEKTASKFYGDGGAFDKHVVKVSRVQAAKAKAAAQAAKAAKAAQATPPPTPPQTPTPTPPPQTPPPTPPTGKKTTPKKVVENLNQQGDLPAGTAAAEIDEITAAAGEAPKPPRKLTARQQKLANRQAKVAKFAAAQSGGTVPVPSAPAPAVPVVPKTKTPVVAKTETPAAPKPPVKTQAPTKPVASATNEEFWEKKGVGKVPLLGTPEQNAALRKRLEETHAAGGFIGKVAADVIDEARASLKPKSDFPEGLSDKLRAAGKENNPKAKKKSKAKKGADEADDLDDLDEADINEPDASPEEADWEAKLKENPQVRAKKSAAKSDSKKPAAKAAATKPAAKSKKGKKEAAPLSLADRIAAKVKAKRDKKNGKNLSALLHRVRYFDQFQTDEGGIPFTGKVAKDRFIKKIRDEDLDRRDANLLRAGGAGALAGLLARGPISAGKRALIGAGAGGLGVLGIRALTNNDRDIYGERNRGSKRAELIPALGGLGAAAWLAGKRFKALAAKFNHKQFNHNRAPGQAGGRATAGWPRRGETRGSERVKGHREHGGGVKELGRGFYSAKLLPSERWIKRSDPRGWVQNEVLPAPDKHSAYSKYVADKMRAIRRLNSGNIPYTQRAQKPVEWLPGAQAQLPSYYFSSRLRGMKHFDDYRLYYFKGRNTGIAARSAEEARSKKKRGGDELVAVRTPSDSEKSQMARGVWVRTRRDGKSPGQSRYGKGRGQGPARKSLSAKLRLKEFSVVDTARRAAKAVGGWAKRNGTAIGLTGAGVGASVAASRYYGPSNKGWKKLDEQKQLAAKFFEKQDGKKRELNPYVGAALSGGASGAVLGGLSILKRGTGALAALKNAGKLGGVSAGIVGGGALLGSRIVGKPREEESAPFTKRAGIGGAIAGAGVGLAGALALRKTKGGAKVLEKAAKNWRPAMWVRESPLAVAGGVGAVGGALYGGAQGLDEGQQVDSIRNLKKDMKTIASDQGERAWKSAARTSVHGFSRKEFQVSPLPDVEPFEATYGRRSGERSKFVRNAAILGAIGLVGVGGYRFGKAAKAAAGGAAKATKSAKAGPRNSQSWKHEAGPDFWEEARRAAYGETGGRSQSAGRSYGSYDSDYAKRSAEAKSNWQREQAKRSSSSSSSSSGTRARGRGEDANPYAGTPKADAWEKWRAMDRMSKESQMPGERESAEKMKAIWKKRHNLARKLQGLKLFGRDDQPRYRGSKAWADPIHGWVTGADLVDKDGNPWKPSSPQLVNAMVNRAKRERIKVQRGYGLTKDVSAVMQGKDRERDSSGRIKKREWEKSWFKNMVTTGALAAAGLVGAGAWRYGRMNPGTGIGRVVTKTEAGVENLKKKADKGMGDFMRGVDDMTGGSRFAAKFHRLREFDAIAAEAGWDARDPRGRSVRVFAPGSRRRERREKAWHEKTENERTLWKAGIAAGILAGGLGGVGIYRLAKGKPLIPRFGKPAAGGGDGDPIRYGPSQWFNRVRTG